MKRKIFSILFALVLVAVVVLPAGVAQAAPALYENHNTGDITYTGFYSSTWSAQTFTAESNHSVTSVKLKLFRSGFPGTITVSIRDTDGAGHPTGSDLTLGTTDGDTLTNSSTGEWREIALTSYNLTSGTKYAIIVRAPAGDVNNLLISRLDITGAYAGGNRERSGNSGTTWTTFAGWDMMFEVHGSPTGVESVNIDIKPGSDPNSINLKSKGVIPVAILTTPDFDATTVDASTVAFGPGAATMVHKNAHFEDVDGDSDIDMVLHFKTRETGIQAGDTEATLTGETVGGQVFEGTDSVRTVGKP